MQNFISIPQPCHENWDAMTPQQQGRHCDKCNIVVKDFSTMSNDEILKFIGKKTDRICGRINSDQLAQVPTLTDKLKKFVYALAIVFLPFIPFDSFGQTADDSTIETVEEYGSIEGKVVNDKGEALPFVTVSIQGTIIGAKSDINGNYRIDSLKSRTYTLSVSSIGYKSAKVENVKVSNRIVSQNVKLERRSCNSKTIIVGIISPRLVNPETPGQNKLSGEEIRRMPR